MSKISKIDKYFDSIDEYVQKSYDLANNARQVGYEPKNKVEIPLAKEISQRVEGLISVLTPQVMNSGIAVRILELEQIYGKLDWRVALCIALEVAEEKFCKFKNRKEAMEIGVRVGFSYITLGVISAPLEGFIDLTINKIKNTNKEYLTMNFAGPIRAAGGTAGAVCVIICDYVRLSLGYAKYEASDDEINRYCQEIFDYNNKCVKLQYFPKEEEIKLLIKNIGIEISGNPTEEIEVSNYKNLPNIKTNRIRGGMCLIVAECLIQKASKLNKRVEEWGKDFGLDSWLFLKVLLELQKQIKSKSKLPSSQSQQITSNNSKSQQSKILPNYKYLDDVVSGRPVFGFPIRKGGFRLRYGRSRTSGFASTSISSQTMAILDDFLAVGSQLRLERPGKATVVTACDTLEAPIVKLNNGDIVKLKTKEQITKYANEIQEIIHLGDLLISYGEFFENNHNLIPNGYCNEEWAVELVDKVNK